MKLSHGWDRGVAAFDDMNLVSCAGLVPVLELAEQTGLSELLISPADKRRAGIELRRAASDPDEDAAVVQMAVYQDKLTGS